MKSSQRTYPDIYTVELCYHPDMWANGGPPDTYKFRVIGGTWGVSRWTVHAIWADKPAPDDVKASLPRLRQLITASLESQTRREVPLWESSCLAWED